jgi:hypothetical protein
MCRIQESAYFSVQRPGTIKRQRLTGGARLSTVLVEHSSNARWATKTRFFFPYSSSLSSLEVLYFLLFHCVVSRSGVRLKTLV